MKMKKLASAALAGAMALTLCTPAFAAANGSTTVTEITDPTQIEVSGSTNVPQVKISVPSTAAVTVNPYRLDVTVNDLTIQDQVLSPTYHIVNESNAKIQASASVTGVAAGAADFAASTAVAETDAKAYVYFEMEAVTDGETNPTTWAAEEQLVLVKDTAVATTAGSEVVMDAGTSEAAGAKKAIAFHFSGDASPVAPWTAEDTLGATLAFTFKPVANAISVGDATLALDKTTATIAASGTDTVTATFNAGTSGLTVTKYDWTSSDSTKASVTAGGTSAATSTTVTNVAAGTATVTVTATLSNGGTLTATCEVTCQA